MNTGNNIPLSVPYLKGNEWQYLKNCLDSEWISTSGPFVDQFEEKIKKLTGVNFAVACINGTSALQLALKVLGVETNDEVLVPSLTFIATINSIKYNNAEPFFLDSDNYYNIDSEKVINFILTKTSFKEGHSYNSITGKKIKAIIVVHVFGNAVFLDNLIDLCKERNIKVIEDATESLGTNYIEGKYKNRHSGSIGDIGCLSFNGNKIITTGGGGMLITNNEEHFNQSKYFSTQAKDDSFNYIHNQIGYNFRLTSLQSALGLAQLEQLDSIMKLKKKIRNSYINKFEKLDGLDIAQTPQYSDNNNWLNILRIDNSVSKKSKEDILIKHQKQNIGSRPIWYLNHLQRPYKNNGSYKLENAIRLFNNSICLPSSANLSDEEIDIVVENCK